MGGKQLNKQLSLCVICVIYSFSEYLLNVYSVSSIGLDYQNTVVNMSVISPAFMEFTLW